jgi:putative effector of murein hydrolase
MEERFVDPLALTMLVVGLSVLPLPLIFRSLHPKTAVWISVLVSLGSVALAVAFFLLWQWLQHPLLAYLDAIVYGLLALLAPLVAINGRLSTSGKQPVPDSQPGLGVGTRPQEPNESGTDSA